MYWSASRRCGRSIGGRGSNGPTGANGRIEDRLVAARRPMSEAGVGTGVQRPAVRRRERKRGAGEAGTIDPPDPGSPESERERGWGVGWPGTRTGSGSGWARPVRRGQAMTNVRRRKLSRSHGVACDIPTRLEEPSAPTPEFLADILSPPVIRDPNAPHKQQARTRWKRVPLYGISCGKMPDCSSFHDTQSCLRVVVDPQVPAFGCSAPPPAKLMGTATHPFRTARSAGGFRSRPKAPNKKSAVAQFFVHSHCVISCFEVRRAA